MRLFHKILLNLCALVSFIVIFYAVQDNRGDIDNVVGVKLEDKHENSTIDKNIDRIYMEYRNISSSVNKSIYNEDQTIITRDSSQLGYNIWCIFTKVTNNSPLRYKFETFVQSLLRYSTVLLTLNIISDNSSQAIAKEIVWKAANLTKKKTEVKLYNVSDIADQLEDVIKAMQSYFSSQPGTYYSDALFFISIGLHRITNQSQVVMMDIDTKMKTDIKLLFDQFSQFSGKTLFAFAPEQNPVYRHVLYMYRSKHRDSKFGESLYKGGNPGVNSGVCLFDLNRMRESEAYNSLLNDKEVKKLTKKYSFQGHLGDQDFYTILSEEYKDWVYLLDCTWNRQLCQWWNRHGYKDIFSLYYDCKGDVKIYHGNCNTQIP